MCIRDRINAPGVTKGSGLKTLADTLGLAMNQVMACGDSGNDLAMIQAAGYGIAMGNATPDVLAAARYEMCIRDRSYPACRPCRG